MVSVDSVCYQCPLDVLCVFVQTQEERTVIRGEVGPGDVQRESGWHPPKPSGMLRGASSILMA